MLSEGRSSFFRLLLLTERRTDSFWHVSNVVLKHESGSNERTFLILVASLESSAFSSKPAEFFKKKKEKHRGMLWAMSANINLSPYQRRLRTQGPKTTCYIPRRLQAAGEEVEAIYGCFRGLTNTPVRQLSLPIPRVSPFSLACTSLFLFVLHPLLNRKLFPSMQSVIHAPASKTLPACFVCRTDGNPSNKVPRLSPLFFKVSPQATALFFLLTGRRRPSLLKNSLKVNAFEFFYAANSQSP